MIGKTLGTFECKALLGKGGMGEVYRAKDQKLGRDVAIKVLPEEFAKDSDRVARFQREAKLLASLNHPNIAAIYGLEESDGTHFLVLELIEGDTLADRLKHGAIPVEESLKFALQIAEALEAAHEKGVIHRDLKPANIKVTPDGKIKVLDFGLAKAFAGEQAEVNLSHSPTLSEAATLQGVILGTAAYMSPEQARGKPVDKRTDIWAFGCVLYEVLTGKAAFQGEDVTEILAAVVKSGVNLDLLPANIHPRVREAITRCLQKDQKDRYRDIGDAQFEIKQVLADPSGIFVQPVTAAKPRKKLRLGIPWFVAAGLLCLIIGGLVVWYLKPTPPPESKRVTRFEYELPEGRQLHQDPTYGTPLAISPDGGYFIYGTDDGLYIRSMDALEARIIEGTDEKSMLPFFSPDGQWIGYLSGSDFKLKKVTIRGGPAVTLCDASAAGGFSWTLDNRILHGINENIMWISDNGGEWKTLFTLKSGLLGPAQMLPRGESVLFTDHSSTPVKVMVHSLKSGKTKELLEGASPQYIETGHIVYGMGDNLYAVPFDIESLDVTAGSVPIVEGVFNTTSYFNYSISNSGMLAYVPGDSTVLNQRAFVWVDREGNEKPLGVPSDSYYDYFKISPDGTRVALTIIRDAEYDLWIRDLVRETMSRFTFTGSYNGSPIWTPDGQRVIFDSRREGERESIYWKRADGSGKAELIASVTNGDMWPASISNDGKILFFGQYVDTETGGYNIGMLSMEGDQTPKLLLQEKYNAYSSQISPDSRWLAYVSDESDREEVYIRPFPEVDSGGRWQVSTTGGAYPMWSPDGRELFYRSPDAIMAVSVETDPTLTLGTPKSLFPNNYIGQFDIHPDGQRFLMMKQVASSDDQTALERLRKINIVLNWFEELKGQVPVGSD